MRAAGRSAYREFSQESPGVAGTVINHAGAQTLRLALVYALLDGERSMDTPRIQKRRTEYTSRSGQVGVGMRGGDASETGRGAEKR